MYVLGLVLGFGVRVNRARRSHKWRELEAQLECVGVALQAPSLVLEPQPAEGLRYPVPVSLELLVESDGIEWLAWTWQGPVGATPPLSPARRACLPAFMRLGDAPLRKVLAFARAWGPLGEGWRRAMPGSFPPYPECRERLGRRAAADQRRRAVCLGACRSLETAGAAACRNAPPRRPLATWGSLPLAWPRLGGLGGNHGR